MANLSITLRCNESCAYCFARGLRRGRGPADMRRGTFGQALAFLARSGIDQVRLLGGEPTLHPSFPRFVKEALRQEFRVLVFSNGAMPEPALEVLAAAPPERTAVLINLSAGGELGARAETLARLGERVVLGLNLSSPAPPRTDVFPLIDTYSLSRAVRLGLAHPSREAGNLYLPAKHYPALGEQLARFLEQATEAGVSVEFDCGFVPCMFPEGTAPPGIGTRCGPIPDLLPDGTAIPCYPLADLWRGALSDEVTARELQTQADSALQPYRTFGVTRACETCHRRAAGECRGGCLAAATRRLRTGDVEASLPRRARPSSRAAHPADAPTEAPRWVIPYIDQPRAFWEGLAEEFGAKVREVYFPLPDESIGSGRPVQPTAHLKEFLSRAPFPRALLVNPLLLPAPVEEAAPRIIAAVRRLRDEAAIVGVTVTSFSLAQRLREALPDLPLTASVLMDVFTPAQAMLLADTFETLVVASRAMRDLPALRALRASFPGRLRLIVNEGCLPGCLFRTQHFREMAASTGYPQSLCDEVLRALPWLRLTGAWVLPQHLHLYAGLHDDAKLAGRVTLRNPERYRRVLRGYVNRRPLPPSEIGGGPAAPLEPLEISEEFFSHTLECGRRCHDCRWCRDYYCEKVGKAQDWNGGEFEDRGGLRGRKGKLHGRGSGA